MIPRIGFGYDIHKLATGEELWLGGIKLDFHLGTVGHSDADVLIHAICDALLGAANLRDIGFHFPDTDPKWKGADSKNLLKGVIQLLLEQPKINPHISKMRKILGQLMNVSEDEVSVKATTSEKLSFVGNEEGIKAYAVALIYKKI